MNKVYVWSSDKGKPVRVSGRCRANAYLTGHKIVKTKNRGYRCKYCDKLLSELRYLEKVRKKYE